jgi:hypothetical protein
MTPRPANRTRQIACSTITGLPCVSRRWLAAVAPRLRNFRYQLRVVYNLSVLRAVVAVIMSDIGELESAKIDVKLLMGKTIK